MPSPPTPTPMAVATGRMGRLYTRAVVDDTMGTMLGIAQTISTFSPPHAHALRDALAAELDQWSAQVDHAHVFQYDAVRSSGEDDAAANEVQLLASRAIAKNLSTLVREFGRLHSSVVRNFVRAIVSGLNELHQNGVACGGLSLSSIFLCEGRVQLGGWFPPTACLRRLQDTHSGVFTDNPFAQSILRREPAAASLHQLLQRDIRSLAFLVVEMLTGARVSLSQLTADHDVMLRQLPSQSLERAFLLELLQSPTTNLKSLRSHPYLQEDPLVAGLPLGDATGSQRELIATLLDKELRKCRGQQRNDAQEVRVWFELFEKRFQRKPRPDERSASIQRLQRRCRAGLERIQELERRLKVLAHSASSSSFGHGLSVSVTSPMATSSPSTIALDIDTMTHNSPYNGESIIDGRRRSPAQNAFLRLLADGSSVTPPTAEGSASIHDPMVTRGRGHELIHQRKEVMNVILGLENEQQ